MYPRSDSSDHYNPEMFLVAGFSCEACRRTVRKVQTKKQELYSIGATTYALECMLAIIIMIKKNTMMIMAHLLVMIYPSFGRDTCKDIYVSGSDSASVIDNSLV